MIHPIPEELVRCDELLGLMELTCGTFMPKEFGMKLDILKLGEIFYTRVILLKKPGAEAFHDLGLNLMKQCVLIHELQLGETGNTKKPLVAKINSYF